MDIRYFNEILLNNSKIKIIIKKESLIVFGLKAESGVDYKVKIDKLFECIRANKNEIEHVRRFRPSKNTLTNVEPIYIRLKRGSDRMKVVHSIEQIWCGVKSGGECVLVGCLYRPPKSCLLVDSKVVESLEEARKLVERGLFDALMITGDFNFPGIDWSEYGGCAIENDTEALKFIDGIEYSFLTQFVYFSTFETKSGEGKNVLDLLFTSEPERIIEVQASAPIGISERAHIVLEWKFSVKSRVEVNHNKKKELFGRLISLEFLEC